MGFALACLVVAAVASVLDWLLRDRSIPAGPAKRGAAWEQDEPMPECFDEMEGDL